jgi:hypothetical protein
MSEIKYDCYDFNEIKEKTGCDDVAAAILVLAKSVRDAAPFNQYNSQHFGHELACALKNVFENSEIKISPTFGAFDEIASAIREGVAS